MTRLLAVALAFAALPVHAVVFEHAGSGFRIDLGADDATWCFVVPRERRSSAACEGVDFEKVEASMGANARLYAFVRYPDRTDLVTAHIAPLPKGARSASKNDARAAMQLPGEQAAYARIGPAEPEFLIINGVQVMHFTVEATDPQNPIQRTSTWGLFGEGSVVFVGYSSDAAHAALAQEAGARAIATISLPHQTDATWVESHLLTILGGWILGIAAVAVWCSVLLKVARTWWAKRR